MSWFRARGIALVAANEAEPGILPKLTTRPSTRTTVLWETKSIGRACSLADIEYPHSTTGADAAAKDEHALTANRMA